MQNNNGNLQIQYLINIIKTKKNQWNQNVSCDETKKDSLVSLYYYLLYYCHACGYGKTSTWKIIFSNKILLVYLTNSFFGE